MDKTELYEKLFGTIDKTTLKTFKEYHLKRPDIYNQFYKYAKRMRATGRKRYSAKCIMEIIRWDYDIKYVDTEFKISNSFTSLYVRLLIWNEPSFLDFFQLKRARGLSDGNYEKDCSK